MAWKRALVCILATVCYAKTINFKDCGSMDGTIYSIDITPCDVEPCQLHANTNYSVHINFTSKVNSKTAKNVVHGIIAGVPVPFPVPVDCCENKNMRCPIVSGYNDIYTNIIFCSPDYPKIRLVVKWEVQDDNGDDIMCYEFPAQII